MKVARPQDPHLPTRVAIVGRSPAGINAEIRDSNAEVVHLSQHPVPLATRVRIRAGGASLGKDGALVAWRHDLLAIGGLDESIDGVEEALRDAAARLSADGVVVSGRVPQVRSVGAFGSSIRPPPRSHPGPKRTLVDSEQCEVRRYLAPIAHGRFLEIGANEPIILSQTHHLEMTGWTGVLVEPIPQLAERLRATRPGSRVVQAVCSRHDAPDSMRLRLTADSGHATLEERFADRADRIVGCIEVPVVAADAVIEEHLGGRVDFISIDVEGHESEVLAGLDLRRWRPRLVLIEDDMSSLRPSRMLWRAGFRMLRRTQNNNWWVPVDARERMTLRERWRMLGKLLRMPYRALQARVPPSGG